MTVIHTYIAAWNETDAAKRRELVAEAFTDDASYLDPLMGGSGTEELTAMIGGAQAQYPGHTFALTQGPDEHNDRVRFTWTISTPDGTPLADGIDFARVADDGRLADVTGFLQPR